MCKVVYADPVRQLLLATFLSLSLLSLSLSLSLSVQKLGIKRDDILAWTTGVRLIEMCIVYI